MLVDITEYLCVKVREVQILGLLACVRNQVWLIHHYDVPILRRLQRQRQPLVFETLIGDSESHLLTAPSHRHSLLPPWVAGMYCLLQRSMAILEATAEGEANVDSLHV